MSARDQVHSLLTLGIEEGSAAALPAAISNFTLRKEFIEHPKFTAVIREIARIHQRGRAAGVAEGLLLVAQTGSGKTTALEYYRARFPRSVEAGVTKIPVLFVETPESPSVKDLAEAILHALGDPAASKGTAAAKTQRIVMFFRECGVQLLLIDEFQHFFDGSRVTESRRVSDWLKSLINKVGVPVVLAGLPRAIQVVNINPQLRRRFATPYYMEPFSFATAPDRLEFRGVLKSIQARLPNGSVDLSGADMARRFYFASHGLFDYVVKIIDDAASRGGTGPGGMLSMADYARAFKAVVWSAAPDQLNPFIETAKLRLLTQPLEPFDIWDDVANYTTRASSRKKQGTTAGGATKAAKT